jgi:hypothetical protein
MSLAGPIAAAALSSASWLLLAAGAAAQPPPTVLPGAGGAPLPCSDYGEVRRQLGTRYGEAPISLGLQSNGNLLQVFASSRSGSWTIVSTSPSGLSCIVAAGRGWEAATPPSADPAA